MPKVLETGLIVRKESKFDKTRKKLMMLFFKEEYLIMEQLEGLLTPKKINPTNIVIPKEIKKNKWCKNKKVKVSL